MKNDTRQPFLTPFRASRATAASNIVVRASDAVHDRRYKSEAAAGPAGPGRPRPKPWTVPVENEVINGTTDAFMKLASVRFIKASRAYILATGS